MAAYLTRCHANYLFSFLTTEEHTDHASVECQFAAMEPLNQLWRLQALMFSHLADGSPQATLNPWEHVDQLGSSASKLHPDPPPALIPIPLNTVELL